LVDKFHVLDSNIYYHHHKNSKNIQQRIKWWKKISGATVIIYEVRLLNNETAFAAPVLLPAAPNRMRTDLEPSPACVQKHVAIRSLNAELDVCV
jgi:hypothetical protein